MRNKLSLVFLVLLFCSCKQKKQRVNYDREFIKSVLIDLHMADAGVTRFMSKDRDSIRIIFYNEVYQIHHTTQEDFDSLMTLLQNNPVDFRDLYAEVKDSLEEMKK